MIRNLQDRVVLNNGVDMPGFGLGVFKVPEGSDVEDSVKAALRLGYRSIDTATAYHNEAGVGKGIRASGIPRDQLFITSKIWNPDQGYEQAFKAFDASLAELGLDYLDLYLIHWPVKGKYIDTWRAMVEIYGTGKARAIGVSNFQIHHLQDILALDSVVPAINQVEMHPLLIQAQLRRFCKDHHIQVESWSPLMRGNLDIPLLQELAGKYHKSPAQIVLRWHVQHDVVVIPKSVHEERILENSLIFDFSLSDADIQAIDGLDRNQRFGSDPDNFNF